jgi:hypothetical protein
LSYELADELHLKQVDLVLKGISEHGKNVVPTLAEYDLKYGSRILYGKHNPVTKMPQYKSSDIPKFEGTWLLRNRGIGLLLAYLYIDNGVIPEEKIEYFFIEVNKAILAMGDALFILAGKYNVLYSDRVEKIKSVLPDDYSESDQLYSKYIDAAQYKLRPYVIKMNRDYLVELWADTVKLFNNFVLYYEGKRKQHCYNTINEYIHAVDQLPKPSLSKRLRLRFDRARGVVHQSAKPIATLKVDKMRSAAMTFALLSSYADSGNECNADICSLVGLNHGYTGALREWREMVKAYLLLIHPKGELGKALGDDYKNGQQ